MDILGVKIDDIKKSDALEKVTGWISGGQDVPRFITTVGPEFLVTASKDAEFKEILNNADLSLPDGAGLRLAGVRNVIPGADFMLDLVKMAQDGNRTIGMLGGEAGVGRRAKSKLEEIFPGVEILWALDGEEVDKIIRYVHSSDRFIVHRETKSTMNTVYNELIPVDLLFVNLGHPKQEKFIWKLINSAVIPAKAGIQTRSRLAGRDDGIIKFKIAMGVGGSFDFLSGNLPRPPKMLRDLGLGWFYRLLSEKPGKRRLRLGRIFNAVVVFPWLLVLEKLKITK